MSDSMREQEPTTPDQLIRMFRLRPRTGKRKKLRQVDLADQIGIETRTLQQWESGERLPSADNLQRLIGVLLAENIFLPGEERREAMQLWEAVSQAYDERPGTYRFYPPFDEHWFESLLHTTSQKTEQAQTTLLETMNEEYRARAVHGLGILVWTQGETARTEQLAREGIEVARRSGNDAILVTTLRLLVYVKLSQHGLATAMGLAEESVQLARKQDDAWNLASSLNALGIVIHTQGNDTRAWQLFEESVKLFEITGDRWEQTDPLRNLGQLARQQGDNERAAKFYKKSIALCRSTRGTWFLARGLEGLAGVECARGNYEGAAILLGAAEKQREKLGATVMPAFRAEYEQTVSLTKNTLNPQSFAEARHRGRAMSAEQAIAYALGDNK